MAKREVAFNAKGFWESISAETCKKKLKGALINLERAMKKQPVTEQMIACQVYLKGKVKKVAAAA